MNLFNNINDDRKDELLAMINLVRKDYYRGEVIFTEGDLCNSIAIVEKGSITASHGFSDGHEKLLRTIEAKETIGISLIFSSSPYYKGTFTSISNSSIAIISKADLYKLMMADETFLGNVLEIIADSSIKLNDHIKLLSYKTIRQRFCSFLYQEYLKNKSLEFNVKYSKTDLAQFINVERPSLSVEISKLCEDGIIENNNRFYKILDLERIENEL